MLAHCLDNNKPSCLITIDDVRQRHRLKNFLNFLDPVISLFLSHGRPPFAMNPAQSESMPRQKGINKTRRTLEGREFVVRLVVLMEKHAHDHF
jgi:hypothetical protein